MKKKITFLTGSGISVESGIPTFRMAADSLWENHDVKTVCTHSAWEANPDHVNSFYNMLRVKYKDIVPNDAHKLIASLEENFEVSVVTQNVDNLHEKAGSTSVLHLHGEIMKCCSDKDVENSDYWITLPKEGFGDSGLEIPKGYETADGGILRPYIVFFEEPVPNLYKAINEISSADIVVVIGTSLTVYPAAGLLLWAKPDSAIYIIDPNDTEFKGKAIHIKKDASEGMKDLISLLC